jgi:hypothetical protein
MRIHKRLKTCGPVLQPATPGAIHSRQAEATRRTHRHSLSWPAGMLPMTRDCWLAGQLSAKGHFPRRHRGLAPNRRTARTMRDGPGKQLHAKRVPHHRGVLPACTVKRCQRIFDAKTCLMGHASNAVFFTTSGVRASASAPRNFGANVPSQDRSQFKALVYQVCQFRLFADHWAS